MANFAVVGQSVYRKDAAQKVTGQVLHVGNIEMPGMLHVAVLRSPANAIEDAIGVRIRDLPITPETILRALAEKNATVGPKG